MQEKPNSNKRHTSNHHAHNEPQAQPHKNASTLKGKTFKARTPIKTRTNRSCTYARPVYRPDKSDFFLHGESLSICTISSVQICSSFQISIYGDFYLEYSHFVRYNTTTGKPVESLGGGISARAPPHFTRYRCSKLTLVFRGSRANSRRFLSLRSHSRPWFRVSTHQTAGLVDPASGTESEKPPLMRAVKITSLMARTSTPFLQCAMRMG